ncbi:MAG: LON peptidase substrate-binding domain-containing protein [Thermoguttaceae bacterium]
MGDGLQFEFRPGDFSGRVRLFPLPSLVLFPHVVQPLHIFEPRYCDLLAEAMAEDRMIAMATLAPGWENDYEGTPPIWPQACLGRVLIHQELEDRTHNVFLAGLSRIEIVSEVKTAKAFRTAKAILRPDRYPEPSDRHAGELLGALRRAMGGLLAHVREGRKELEELLQRDVSLGTLTDLVAYLIDVDQSEKLALLAEDDVVRRAQVLVDRLLALSSDTRPPERGDLPFPPLPSRN